jgi:hypothetical protein
VTPDASTLTFHITGTAPSTVVAGNPTTLSNQSWKLDVPGSVLTAGVNLGLLNPGDIVAGSITAGVFASNTKEGTQVSAAIPVSIGPISVDDITGLANDASTTFAVPDMTWTAVGGDVGYAFAESVTTVTIGPLNVIFTCEPDAAAGQFLITLVTGSTTIPPAGRGSTTTTLADQVLGDQLARTGYSPMYQVVLGLTLLDLGYLVLSAARPPRRRRIIA